MATKITQKIVGVEVVGTEPVAPDGVGEKPPMDYLSLTVPDELPAYRYKIKPPMSEHAYYITITYLEHDGRKLPWEIFINTMDVSSSGWIIAFTRMVSAVFRHGGDIAFIVREMKAVFDPKGGYFVKGRYVPSVAAHVGYCIERCLINIGVLAPQAIDLPAKVQAATAEQADTPTKGLCPSCQAYAIVRLDGCDTCIECGYSKCG